MTLTNQIDSTVSENGRHFDGCKKCGVEKTTGGLEQRLEILRIFSLINDAEIRKG